MKRQNEDCSSLGGIEPQTNLPFIPHQIEDYGAGIPVELAKQISQIFEENNLEIRK